MPSKFASKRVSNLMRHDIRKLRRASTQVSPALREETPERPISSNDVIDLLLDNRRLQIDEDAMDTGPVLGNSGSPRTDREANVISAYSTHITTVSTEPPQPSRDNLQLEIPKRASLMGIPVELRIMIFKLVFPPSEPRGSAETTLYCAPTLRVLGPSHSQICRVSRQIYEETRELLYGQTLVFLSREALKTFSASRTKQQLSHLRSICMKWRSTDWTDAIKTLELPPAAYLTVHWPIERNLWDALTSNKTLDWRQVSLAENGREKVVVFEPHMTVVTKMPLYEQLEQKFN